MTPPAPDPLLVLIPVFNEWEAVGLLLPHLDRVLAARGSPAEVVLIDDASTAAPGGCFPPAGLSAGFRVGVLRLARNLGHQRAIAVGLAWAAENRAGRRVVLLDGDGEDNPDDVPRLLATADADPSALIVFAARTRRAERWTFQAGYRVYQVLHRILTGLPVRVGNFSVLAPEAVTRLSVISETWNHYAAAVIHSRVPHAMIPTARAKRLAGRSRMNFTALVVHGLSALSIFSPVIGVRLLGLWAALTGVTVCGLGASAAFSPAALGGGPDWLPWLLALALLVLVQQFTIGVVFVLLVLGGRQSTSFIPRRDYKYFVAGYAELDRNA